MCVCVRERESEISELIKLMRERSGLIQFLTNFEQNLFFEVAQREIFKRREAAY